MQHSALDYHWRFTLLYILVSYILFLPSLISQSNLEFYADPEARALWFTRFQYGKEKDIREKIQQAKQANFNIILFQVRGKADAFYFSSYEPWSDRFGGNYPGFDPLEVAIDEAHRNGIELHAYLNVFTMWSGPILPESPIHIYNTHRDWVAVNSSGIPMDPATSEYVFGSPGIPEYIDHLFTVFMEIVEKYDVDGIHLDRIRYPSTNYSYDSTSVTRFKQETGLSSPYTDPFRWAQWQRDQVSNFVYKVYEGIMARKPWVKLSAAVWGNYYDGFTDKLQDPRVWLKNGKIDFIAPMIYETDMGVYQSRLNNHARSTWGRHVYGGIGANVFNNHPFSVDEVFQQIEISRQVKAHGSVLYSASSLNQELIQSLSGGPYQVWLPAPAMSWKPIPLITHVPLKDTEDITNPYPIVATIQSSVPLVSDSLLLVWSCSSSFDDYSIERFSLLSDSTYQAFIPPQNNQTIYYYLLAKNEEDYIAQLPRWAPINVFTFYAGTDELSPVISYQQEMFNSFYVIDSINFQLDVTDNLGLDTNSVFVHFSWIPGIMDSLQLTPELNTSQFIGDIDLDVSLGDTIYYYFTAQDISSRRNRAKSDVYLIPIGVENFEGTVEGWHAESGWQISDHQYLSGIRALKFSPPAGFSGNSVSSFQTTKLLNLERLESATLHFWTRYLLDKDLVVGYIDVSIDNGINWTPIGPVLSGYSNQWSEYYFSLSEYCGQGKPGILVRFRAQSILDPGQEHIEWFVDDISIIRGETAVLVNDIQKLPHVFQLYQNYPNPFNSATVIEYEVNSPKPVAIDLNVINLKGQLVKTLISKKQSRGHYFTTWNGKNEQGIPVPSGVYFYQVYSPEFKTVRKMIVVR